MKIQITYWRSRGEVVRPTLALIIMAAGGVLGAASLGNNPSVPPQNHIASASTEFEASGEAEVHATWTDSQAALQFPTGSEITKHVEAFSPAPPTRRSFMASWNSTTGANGYLLDVSTSPSFDRYLDGYRDLDVGNVTGSVVTGLNPSTTYYYRVRAYEASGIGEYSDVRSGTTAATTGLTIIAVFDVSIILNLNAAAIEAMINRCISIYESLFSDPITIQIYFRYATYLPDGTPLPAGAAAVSQAPLYIGSWSTFIDALRADGRTNNDFRANLSLPGAELSPNIIIKSANGRAVELDTPPDMFAMAISAPEGPMMVSLRLILRCHFSSLGLPCPAMPTRSILLSMKWMRSWALDRALATLAASFGHKICSAGRHLDIETLLLPARAISRSITAAPTSLISVKSQIEISAIG